MGQAFSIRVLLITSCLVAACVSSAQSQETSPSIAEAAGRAFLEAEAQNWIKTWIDQHPPVNGVQGFGGKTMFVVQLLFAVDSYARADTDKERFHASLQGASAYLAYAYAATPAVGLAVTAVVLVAGIVESSIAGSYAEAMLAIQKDMIATQARIGDLVFRNGMARAHRLMALLEAAQKLVLESAHLDERLRLDCRERAGDFEALGHCLELLTQVVTRREQIVLALESLLALPDGDLANIGAPVEEAGADGGPAAGHRTAAQPIDVAELGARARARLVKAREEAAKNLEQIRNFYDPFLLKYQKLAVSYMIDEALSEPQRLAAVEAVRHRCLLDHTQLAQAAARVTFQLAALASELKGDESSLDLLTRSRALGADADGLLASWEQRRISCPEVARDDTMANQISFLRNRLAALPRP